MQSSRALRIKMMQLLAADAATLAQAADPNHVVLLMEPVTPSEGLVMADVTPADFTGSTPIEVELGAQGEGLDANTDDGIISILPPVGGWRWETTGTTNLPQTIYGFALTNEAETTLYGAEALETPIVLTGVNQVVQLPAVEFRELAGCLS